ncbi:ribonuclease H-like domain-containing protein [Tanacetum coccineum]
MVTRSRVGTTRPNPCYAGHVSTISPLPRSYKEAFNDPNWRNAMFNEYNALIKNKTWTSVPRPEGANIVCSMWLFRHKFLADGTLSRYKARLVANGSTQGDDTAFLLLFVDDIVLTASSNRLLQQIIASLHREFSMTDLGALNYFLGISVTRDSFGMFLSLRKYAMEILEHAHMVGYNSSRTPIDTESKLRDGGTPVVDPTLYRSLVGSLQYLTFTRPDITYAVQQVCLYMHDPREPHFSALKRILRAEAEYCSVANAVAETCWIRNLLRELHTPLSSATIVYCDNVSAVYLSSNPVQHQCTKHIDIDIHFVRDLVATGQIPTNQKTIFARNRIRMSLGNLSSCEYDYYNLLRFAAFSLPFELQAIISACRRTRFFVTLINKSLTVMRQGYAIVDLRILSPSEVPDICLSKFVTLLVQFISQRQRPVRGSALLDYFQTFPCRASFTAAGCYLCP